MAEAATKTAEHGSSRVEFTIAMNVGGESFDMTGSGAFDYLNPRGFLTYRMALPGLGDMRMDLRMIGMKMFMRMPAELTGQALPGGKEWVGLDLGKSLERRGSGASTSPSRAIRPRRSSTCVRRVATSARPARRGERRADDALRRRMDFRKALDAGLDELELSDAEREQARKGMQAMIDQLGTTTVPIEVFVDGDGMLRRLKMALATRSPGTRS